MNYFDHFSIHAMLVKLVQIQKLSKMCIASCSRNKYKYEEELSSTSSLNCLKLMMLMFYQEQKHQFSLRSDGN